MDDKQVRGSKVIATLSQFDGGGGGVGGQECAMIRASARTPLCDSCALYPTLGGHLRRMHLRDTQCWCRDSDGGGSHLDAFYERVHHGIMITQDESVQMR